MKKPKNERLPKDFDNIDFSKFTIRESARTGNELSPKQMADQILDRVEYIGTAEYVVQMIINSNPHSNPLSTQVESTMDFWLAVKDCLRLKWNKIKPKNPAYPKTEPIYSKFNINDKPHEC